MKNALLSIILFPIVLFAQNTAKTLDTKNPLTYSNFNAYVTAKGSGDISPYFAGSNLVVTGRLNVPINIDFAAFLNGSKFSGQTGSGTDTIEISKMSAIPMHKIFDTTLTVMFKKGVVNEFYPQWWGAVGDTTTGYNNGIFIQYAIDCASRSGGGVVKLLSGDYTVSDSIQCASNVYIIGSGKNSTSLTISDTNQNMFVLRSDTNVIISGFTMIGGGKNHTDAGEIGSGIYAHDDCHSLRFIELEINYFKEGTFIHQSTDVVMDRCNGRGNSGALCRWLGVRGGAITNCIYNGSRSIGDGKNSVNMTWFSAETRSIFTENVTVSNCYSDSTSYEAFLIREGNHCTIQGCHARHAQCGFYAKGNSNVLIGGTVRDGEPTNPGGGTFGVVLYATEGNDTLYNGRRSTASNITVENVKVGAYIRNGNDTEKTENISLNNMKFIDCSRQAVQIGGNTRYISLNGGQIYNCGWDTSYSGAIDAVSTRYLNINNYIISKTWGPAIAIRSSSKRVKISDCIIDTAYMGYDSTSGVDSAFGAIEIYEGEYVNISNNDVYGSDGRNAFQGYALNLRDAKEVVLCGNNFPNHRLGAVNGEFKIDYGDNYFTGDNGDTAGFDSSTLNWNDDFNIKQYTSGPSQGEPMGSIAFSNSFKTFKGGQIAAVATGSDASQTGFGFWVQGSTNDSTPLTLGALLDHNKDLFVYKSNQKIPVSEFVGATICSHDDTIAQVMSTSYKIDSVFMYTAKVNNVPLANLDTIGDRVILNYNGYWDVGLNCSVYSGTGNIDVKTVVFLNEVEQDDIHTQVKFPTANYFQLIPLTGRLYVTDAPDTVTIRSRVNTGTPTLNYTYASLWVKYAGTN